MPSAHREFHRVSRVGWLRASVLGANDGIISVASLVVGVASAGAPVEGILVTGMAGLVAGAMSMAAGEYVSVRTQADAESADLRRERDELTQQPERELLELAAIYRERGLDETLARQVAAQLTAHDALAAHGRDELGITEALRARPVQAALASATSFAVGAAVPLTAVALAPGAALLPVCSGAALITLLLLGAAAARVGGASVVRGALRVGFWGSFAMAVTALIGRWFGAVI